MKLRKRALESVLMLSALAATGCSDTGADAPGAGDDAVVKQAAAGLVRGRVRLDDGEPLGRVAVRSGGFTAITHSDGSFELEVPKGDVRVTVDSDEFTGGEQAVRIRKDTEATVDLSVTRLRRIQIPDAEKGGRFKGDRGFAVELPERSLRRGGDVAKGEAEIRYAVINQPARMAAAPDLRARVDGRDERLLSEGMLEVRFYQDDERLEFEGEAVAEMDLPAGSRLKKGDKLALYHYDLDDLRWKEEASAEIEDGRWRATVPHFSWWTAANILERTSCISGRLLDPDGNGIEGTAVTSIGVDVLWLSTATVSADGSFCSLAPAGSSQSLSAFWDNGFDTDSWGEQLQVPEKAAECGGDGCNDVGIIQLEGTGLRSQATQDGGTQVTGGDGGGGTGAGSGSGNGGTNAGSNGGLIDAGAQPPVYPLTTINKGIGPGETVNFPFTAMGGERLAYRVISGIPQVVDLVLRSPSGATVSGAGGGVSAMSTTYYEDQFLLPLEAGEYVIEATPRSGGSGNLTIELFGVPPDVQATTSIDGGVVDAVITSVGQDIQITFDAPVGGERLAYYVTSSATSVIDISWRDPINLAVSAAGSAVGAGSSLFEDEFTLPPIPGTYTITLNARTQGLGSLTFELISVPADAQVAVAVDAGPTAMGPLSQGQNGVYTFSGTANQRLAYRFQNDTNVAVDLRVFDPSGTQISGGSSATGAGSTVFEDLFVLPGLTGDYTVTVSPRSDGVGSVSLDLFAVPAEDVKAITLQDFASSTPQVFNLSSIAQDGALDFTVNSPNELVAYTLDSSVNTVVDTRMFDNIGSAVTGGNHLVSANATAFSGLITTPGTTGTYRLEVDPRTQGVGNVSVRVYRVSPANKTTGVTVGGAQGDVTVDFPGQMGSFTFSASSGSTFHFDVSSDEGTSTDIALTAPSSTDIIDNADDFISTSVRQSVDYVAPATGVYTLQLVPRNGGVETYHVQVLSGAR